MAKKCLELSLIGMIEKCPSCSCNLRGPRLIIQKIYSISISGTNQHVIAKRLNLIQARSDRVVPVPVTRSGQLSPESPDFTRLDAISACRINGKLRGRNFRFNTQRWEHSECRC